MIRLSGTGTKEMIFEDCSHSYQQKQRPKYSVYAAQLKSNNIIALFLK